MAYPITDGVLAMFKAGKPQLANITFSGTQQTMTITEKDIVAGGLSVDRYTVSGQRIELGSAVASELTLHLKNLDGKFNETTFEGAELYVQIAAYDPDSTYSETYVPLGYFTVDNSPRKLSSIYLTALDRMVLFDKPVKISDLTFPTTVGTLLSRICQICNVPLKTSASSLTNYSYRIESAPEGDDLTYRQILQWIAEITGTCAYIDWEGKLRLEWYSDTSATTIGLEDRYSSDIYENDITITGVKIVADEETEYISGTDEYCFVLEGNGLIQGNAESILAPLASKLVGFTYTPYTCSPKRMPHLYPLDCITLVDSKGVSHKTIITNTVFQLNNRFEIAGKGETATTNGYAARNPLTKQERTIINVIAKQAANEQLGDRVQQVVGLNEAIAGAIGLHTTQVRQSDGSFKYYFHTNPVLEDSTEGQPIYTFSGGGFAVSLSGWNNGNPVWETGITKEGNAVFNYLSVNGISADIMTTGTIQSHDGKSYWNLDTGEFHSESVASNIDDGVEEANANTENAVGAAKSELSAQITSVSTTVQQLADSLALTIVQTMMQSDEWKTMQENITKVTATANGLNVDISTTTSNLEGFLDKFHRFFQFTSEGLIQSVEGSPYSTLLGNERLSLRQGGEEVAYIQYNRLYVTEACIKRLSVGFPDDAKYVNHYVGGDGVYRIQIMGG